MYQEYPPCQLLAPYIDKYWEFKGETEYDMHYKILPDGCTDFIFSIGEPSQPLNGEMLLQPYRFYFVGPLRVYSELVTRSTRLHMMGVRVSPCGPVSYTHLAGCLDIVLYGRRDTGVYTYIRSCFGFEYGGIESELHPYAFHGRKVDYHLYDVNRTYRGTDIHGQLYERVQKEGLHISPGKYINVICNAL